MSKQTEPIIGNEKKTKIVTDNIEEKAMILL